MVLTPFTVIAAPRPVNTRKLSYRKDDGAMGALKNFGSP